MPRDPKLGPQEQAHLVKAAATWDPQGNWALGGGGTVWDGMAYDPALDLVYIGTGNGSPYSPKERSPRGGDNLYLASIIAIHAQSGEMAWYYQQVPEEAWDYTATMKMILADLDIDGRQRQVLMQAPKNGFFYVLDRATGELISAKNYAFVNWTKGIDLKSGRPIPNPAVDYTAHPKLVFPGMAGAHNWQPMSYSPKTGLVYIPVIDLPMVYIDTAKRRAGLIEGMFTVAGIPPEGYDPGGMAGMFGKLPSIDSLAKGVAGKPRSRGVLRAWDPVRQRVMWEQPTFSFWDGGVLSTGGNLVFQGDAEGVMTVRAADSGALLARIGTPAEISRGEVLFNRYCLRCHVFGRGLLPDLRRMSPTTHQLFDEIVLQGAYRAKGMASWSDVLTEDDARSIHAYLIDQAGVAAGSEAVDPEELRN